MLDSIPQILYNVGFAWSWWLGLSFRESESEDGEQWLWTSDDRVLNPNITYWGSGEVTNKKIAKAKGFLEHMPSWHCQPIHLLEIGNRAMVQLGAAVQFWPNWESAGNGEF